eukprot:2116233-Prymnesium_polylepis.2
MKARVCDSSDAPVKEWLQGAPAVLAAVPDVPHVESDVRAHVEEHLRDDSVITDERPSDPLGSAVRHVRSTTRQGLLRARYEHGHAGARWHLSHLPAAIKFGTTALANPLAGGGRSAQSGGPFGGGDVGGGNSGGNGGAGGGGGGGGGGEEGGAEEGSGRGGGARRGVGGGGLSHLLQGSRSQG